jgi:hypothetical protein
MQDGRSAPGDGLVHQCHGALDYLTARFVTSQAVAFDPFVRVGEGTELERTTLAAFRECLAREERRERRRRPSDAARHADAVSCLLANVVAAELALPGLALAVRRRARDGGRVVTDAPVFGSGLNSALAAGERAGLFIPGKLGVYSVAEPTAELLAMIPRSSLGITSATDQPAIILRGRKDAEGRAPMLPFDPASVAREAGDMSAVNKWLRQLPLEILGPPAWVVPTRDARVVRVVTSHARACSRIFINGTFTQGGRLYRPCWLGMRKAERFERIRLGGERIAEVDYRSMFLRLAYRAAGLAWPFPAGEDGYAPASASDEERAGLKTCTNALLHGARGRQFPAETAGRFSPATLPRDVYAAIRARHPALQAAGVFGSLIGHELTRAESDLMVALLLWCRDHGLPALGVHDALLVPASRAEETRAAMQRVATERLGCALPARIRGGIG